MSGLTAVFEKSLELSKGRPHYTFFDGPPFVLNGYRTDVVTRWAQQNGFHVERRFGWDTHGLPVEFEVDKTLGIKGPADILKMGIDKYNSECRSIVMRYANVRSFN
uniref:tRNA-synt_1 domain-containing protein n=1 Tax=Heterorhabditis bacteriophora TaxID=37862 RepID=A0A1I7XEL6_HETBA